MSKLSQQILEIVKDSDKHMTAEEIFLLAKKKKVDISLASVYRVLNSLSEEGCLRRISFSNKADVYDKSVSDHGHLVCSKCKETVDLEFKDLRKILLKQTGVDFDYYELTINYVCEKCKRLKEKRK
ncbi:MAG: transcriptional repressor [Firmicutes bacterium]|nr:transcriptional repressor [Candidatus Colivicinus equi]